MAPLPTCLPLWKVWTCFIPSSFQEEIEKLRRGHGQPKQCLTKSSLLRFLLHLIILILLSPNRRSSGVIHQTFGNYSGASSNFAPLWWIIRLYLLASHCPLDHICALTPGSLDSLLLAESSVVTHQQTLPDVRSSRALPGTAWGARSTGSSATSSDVPAPSVDAPWQDDLLRSLGRYVGKIRLQASLYSLFSYVQLSLDGLLIHFSSCDCLKGLAENQLSLVKKGSSCMRSLGCFDGKLPP
jgi:hypothetical protein